MSIWEILKIESTKDQRKIKQAYAKLIVKYHPEEYPEEFEQIQTAFALAIKYAKGEVLEEAKVIEITRIEEEQCKDIFSEPVDEMYISDRDMNIMDYIQEIHFYIRQGDVPGLIMILEKEDAWDYKHTPYFNMQISYFIQKYHAMITKEQYTILKEYLFAIRNAIGSYDRFLIKTFNALERYYKQGDFYTILLNTKDDVIIQLYKEYVDEVYLKPMPMLGNIRNLVLKARLHIQASDVQELQKLFNSYEFQQAKQNIFFVRGMSEQLQDFPKWKEFSQEMKECVVEFFDIDSMPKYLQYILLNTLDNVGKQPKKRNFFRWNRK